MNGGRGGEGRGVRAEGLISRSQNIFEALLRSTSNMRKKATTLKQFVSRGITDMQQ